MRSRIIRNEMIKIEKGMKDIQNYAINVDS